MVLNENDDYFFEGEIIDCDGNVCDYELYCELKLIFC